MKWNVLYNCTNNTQVSGCSLAMTTPMDKTKYVEDWTTKHSRIHREDTASLARRKLPAAPGNSSPDSATEDVYDANSELNSTSNVRPFDRYRNLSMPKRSITSLMQGSVKSNPIKQQNVRDRTIKRNEVSKQNLTISSKNSGSSSTPNSARSGSSESSGYHSIKDVERLSARRKPVASSSLSQAPSRSNSSLTSHEVEFQAWKRRKEYKPTNASER